MADQLMREDDLEYVGIGDLERETPVVDAQATGLSDKNPVLNQMLEPAREALAKLMQVL